MAEMDFNDIHREYGIDALRNHIDQHGSAFEEPSDTLSTAGVARHPNAREKRRATPEWVSAMGLCRQEFPAIKYVMPGYIAEGCTLFAGKPKLGKSWFCLDIALAVASGGVCLGNVKCDQGDVLYLALEDKMRRLQTRIKRVWQTEDLRCVPVPSKLELATEWPRANDGGIDFIREWIEEKPEARLVIVDVLAMFKTVARGGEQTLYETEYMAIKELQTLAITPKEWRRQRWLMSLAVRETT
ncbi:MAG: AAA family ATPase [Pseudomonadota bacterium]